MLDYNNTKGCNIVNYPKYIGKLEASASFLRLKNILWQYMYIFIFELNIYNALPSM
jgi:hypothetical protein